MEAKRRERILTELCVRMKKQSERAAMAEMNAADRSSIRRWRAAYAKHGVEGLMDWREPPEPERVPQIVREAICTLRRADPATSVQTIIEHVAKFHDVSVGPTTVKNTLAAAGLARRRGSPAGNTQAGAVPLEFAGMKLVEAAAVQSGALTALVNTVVEVVASAPRSAEAVAVDRSDRDAFGRFEPGFNRRYRKQPGDVIGPGFKSVEQTRSTKLPTRFHITQVEPEVIERKLWALIVSPLLGTGRWDGIRIARGDLLGELCGFPYMPSTLDLFTRELKFLGASSSLWETHARIWLAATRGWGDERSCAVLFIDGSTKPLWTELFTKASKVSATGRVMPSLETICFHTGYGVPLWQTTYSGRAPLVREVPALLERLEQVVGAKEVGRILVIDAEGNSIPFLKGIEAGPSGRAWITRLRPNWVESKRIFNRSNFTQYRDGDRVRMGVADFKDPSGGSYRMRVIEVERRSTGNVTYLGASMRLPEGEWSAKEVANLYFDRWPNQEADFRAVNQAVGSKEVHGYGKKLVDNVAVITQIDELRQSLVLATTRSLEHKVELAAVDKEARAAMSELKRQQRRLSTVSSAIDRRIATSARITPAVQQLSAERIALDTELPDTAARAEKIKHRRDKLGQATRKTEERIATLRDEVAALETRRTIFRSDVELDSTFAVLKVSLVLFVRYALRHYFGNPRMDPVTFLERVATLRGSLRYAPDLEIVTIADNPRDPDVMTLLRDHAATINAAALRLRSGRVLRLVIEPPPPALRPPPPRRTKSSRRFAR